VAIWQTLGGGVQRGVVALGEVVGVPAMMTDAQNPYWLNPADGATNTERVPVRYVSAPRLPCGGRTRERVPREPLSVARAHGGTASAFLTGTGLSPSLPPEAGG
jgi:hypothetical protein